MNLIDVSNYFDDIDPASLEYWCCQDEVPTLADFSAFQNETGFRLPGDFREFSLSRLGGLHVEVPERMWPRIQGGPFWKFSYGFSIFGLGPKVPDWLNLNVQFPEFREYAEADLMPFMKVIGDAGRYCFTRSGQIEKWDNETFATVRVEMSFPALLMSEVRALETRRSRLKQTEPGK